MNMDQSNDNRPTKRRFSPELVNANLQPYEIEAQDDIKVSVYLTTAPINRTANVHADDLRLLADYMRGVAPAHRLSQYRRQLILKVAKRLGASRQLHQALQSIHQTMGPPVMTFFWCCDGKPSVWESQDLKNADSPLLNAMRGVAPTYPGGYTFAPSPVFRNTQGILDINVAEFGVSQHSMNMLKRYLRTQYVPDLNAVCATAAILNVRGYCGPVFAKDNHPGTLCYLIDVCDATKSSTSKVMVHAKLMEPFVAGLSCLMSLSGNEQHPMHYIDLRDFDVSAAEIQILTKAPSEWTSCEYRQLKRTLSKLGCCEPQQLITNVLKNNGHNPRWNGPCECCCTEESDEDEAEDDEVESVNVLV